MENYNNYENEINDSYVEEPKQNWFKKTGKKIGGWCKEHSSDLLFGGFCVGILSIYGIFLNACYKEGKKADEKIVEDTTKAYNEYLSIRGDERNFEVSIRDTNSGETYSLGCASGETVRANIGFKDKNELDRFDRNRPSVKKEIPA